MCEYNVHKMFENNVLSLTSSFPRFWWSNHSYFYRWGWAGLWLSEVLQGVQHESTAILFRRKKVDILMQNHWI